MSASGQAVNELRRNTMAKKGKPSQGQPGGASKSAFAKGGVQRGPVLSRRPPRQPGR